MVDDVQRARRAVDEWNLGQTSARYESSGQGAGVISTGRGDRGGVSYGAYQLSTRMGTLSEYLNQSSYGQQFKGLTPATPAFNAKWKELARTDPEFAQDQHEFIGRSHYGEQRDKLEAAGLDLSGRGRAVQDAIWSTSVQFRGLTTRIFDKGLGERFGRGYELSKLSDRDIVEAVQDYKIAHNEALFRSSPEWQPGLLRRANAEKTSLVRLAVQEDVLRRSGYETNLAHTPVSREQLRQHPAPATSSGLSHGLLKAGEQSERVRTLQSELSKFGYADADGRPLKVDGNFGQNTADAVRAFQRARGLHVDGVVGSETRVALIEAGCVPLLSERTHPENALFQEVLSRIGHLKMGGFRAGLEADNVAAALASKAKQAGMNHIDHVMLNSQGDRVIGVQGSLQDPARQLVFVYRADAVSQSVERSTNELAEHAASRQQAQVHTQMQHMEHRSGLSFGMKP